VDEKSISIEEKVSSDRFIVSPAQATAFKDFDLGIDVDVAK
jgi:hypothetical protein